MDLENLIKQISSTELFLRLKNVIENYDGFHDHEDVYSHSIKTANIAKEQREGNFITDLDIKQSFSNFMNENIYGILRKDVLVLVALLHDCGKILSYKENGAVHTLITKRTNFTNQTTCPGHEYYGGTITVSKILENISINENVKKYITTLVRLHDSLNNFTYYTQKQDWPMDSILSDIKSRAEGYYIEAMFNAYCDCFTAPPFQPAKEMIERVFNNPLLYNKRVYFIE